MAFAWGLTSYATADGRTRLRARPDTTFVPPPREALGKGREGGELAAPNGALRTASRGNAKPSPSTTTDPPSSVNSLLVREAATRPGKPGSAPPASPRKAWHRRGGRVRS